MNYSQTEKMHILGMVSRGEAVPSNELNNFILLDLVEDGLIALGNEPYNMHITYFGFRELENWDPVLQISINNQLLLKPYGYA